MEGDFSFISNPLIRIYLKWDYKVVKEHNLWDYFRAFDETNQERYLYHISKYDWWEGHTILTRGLSLKTMEYIARYGWNRYYEMVN